jgi:CRISPR-associated endonuclease Cas2
VIFDIPQTRRAQRNILRHKLQEIGFVKLQNSVWTNPYDHEELITLLKLEYGLGAEVLYIIADSIENDRGLRGRFGLV